MSKMRREAERIAAMVKTLPHGMQRAASFAPRTACECGHPIADHAESGWGPNTVCVAKLDTFPDGGYYGVCPCVRIGAVSGHKVANDA